MLRRWFSLRSMMWHLLMIAIVSGCSYAAWWQWHRAAGGNTLSYLYSIEWPAFAVIAIIGWWQLVTEKPEELEARREARRQASLPKPVAYDTEVLRRELAAHPELVRTFPELVKAFPELAAPGRQLARGALAAALPGEAAPPGEAALPGEAVLAGEAAGTARSGSVAAEVEGTAPSGSEGVGEGVTAAPSQEIRAYNEFLGRSAATGKPKTWRNPRGKA